MLSTRTAVILFAFATGPALACPNESLVDMPWFAELTMAIGYEIDPFKVSTNAGGSGALRDCSLGGDGLDGYEGDGYVDPRPDVVLNWTGGGPRFAVTNAFDEPTLLLVRDPNGGWHFDEGAEGEAPLVVFENPTIGAYAIYNGVLGEPHATSTGELIITQTGF